MKTITTLASTLAFLSTLQCATAATPDPTVPAADVKVSSATYEDRSERLRISKKIANTAPITVKGVVYYADPPADNSPLVVFVHGMHYVCKSKVWKYPCPAANDNIDSYLGYEYVGRVMASQGFIVISIDANAINAFSNLIDDAGADLRGELTWVHLSRWKTWSRQGSNVAGIGNTFKGKVDLDNVGLVGHSRGGEGVVHAFALNNTAQAKQQFGIKAVFVLAGTNIVKRLTGVSYKVRNQALGVLLPYCDGDVEDLSAVTVYDDSRYKKDGDSAEKSYVAVMGANHNYYNSVWAADPTGTPDDWQTVAAKLYDKTLKPNDDPQCGKKRGDSNPFGRLSQAEQQQTGIGYIAGFMRLYLKNENALRPLITGDQSLADFRVINGFQASAKDRFNVNLFQNVADLKKNTAGGIVTTTLLKSGTFCTGSPSCGTVEAHRTTGQFSVRWQNPAAPGASIENDIPKEKGDVSSFKFFSFRAGINARDNTLNTGSNQDFSITLTDTAGIQEGVVLSTVHNLFFPPAMFYKTWTGSAGQRTVLHTVRVPLASFKKVDLTKITAITMQFDQPKYATGGVLFNDFVFAQ